MARPLALAPSGLDDLGGAFNAAWLTLLLVDGHEMMDGPAARKVLAARIMEAAAAGETDRERLKAYALQAVLRPDSVFG